jgi:probable F420-dependent oxidoreductase
MSPRIALTWAGITSLGVPNALGVARRATDLGFRNFWVPETTGTESFALLAAIGAATSGIGLATGVIPIQLRTPALAAMGAATLQALHPDRDVHLGIGISSPAVNRWHGAEYGDRPLARIREYVHVVRLCLSGETVSFSGDFFSLDRFHLGVRLGERKPRIAVAALNPGMLTLAGEIADDVLLNYLPPSHVAPSVAAIRRGGDARIHAYVHCCVGDPERHLSSARRDLYSYAAAPGYQRMFRDAGYGEEMDAMASALRAGDKQRALEAISQRMAQDIDTVGDADHVRAYARSYLDGGVDDPILMVLPWGDDRTTVVNETMEAFAQLTH